MKYDCVPSGLLSSAKLVTAAVQVDRLGNLIRTAQAHQGLLKLCAIQSCKAWVVALYSILIQYQKKVVHSCRACIR
jgi:hypothetical protein